MTTYIVIRADSSYSKSVASCMVREFLESNATFTRDDGMCYRFDQGVGSSYVQLAMADERGNYSSDGSELPSANVIEFILPDEGNERMHEIAKKLSSFLAWEFVELDH